MKYLICSFVAFNMPQIFVETIKISCVSRWYCRNRRNTCYFEVFNDSHCISCGFWSCFLICTLFSVDIKSVRFYHELILDIFWEAFTLIYKPIFTWLRKKLMENLNPCIMRRFNSCASNVLSISLAKRPTYNWVSSKIWEVGLKGSAAHEKCFLAVLEMA